MLGFRLSKLKPKSQKSFIVACSACKQAVPFLAEDMRRREPLTERASEDLTNLEATNSPSYTKFFVYILSIVTAVVVIQATGRNYWPLSYIDAALNRINKGPVDSTNRTSKPIDCAEVLRNGYNESGVYTIWPKSQITNDKSLDIFCDMDTDGGGWTVLQRRGNFLRPNDYFFQDWASYKTGFGDIEKDFWIGNDNIFALTNQRLYSIRFDLTAVDGEKRHALYDTFWIDDENNKYTLHIKDYSGDSGDSMSGLHNNQKFSTKDQDNDNYDAYNCARMFKAGWWFNACHSSNLNGLYLGGKHISYADGVNWESWKGYQESLEATEMKIRPKDFRRNLIQVDAPQPR